MSITLIEVVRCPGGTGGPETGHPASTSAEPGISMSGKKPRSGGAAHDLHRPAPSTVITIRCKNSMKTYNIIIRLTVGLAVGAVLVPLAVVLLLSAVVLIIPAAPIVAVAVLAALLVLAVRGKQVPAIAGMPPVDARPDRCPLPRARARSVR